MDTDGKRWTVKDRYGNFIYLTQERWEHIIDPNNHPKMELYEEFIKMTIIKGKRHQEPLHHNKYRYKHRFDVLFDEDNQSIEVVVIIDFNNLDIPNNWIVTAYLV
ncbi:MAG: hypothetical protein BWK80_48920 [Desulfobacteraceae bacterium IS3]|nr:MAG: hypothetical protein BWK80_48920 [Desulfobacteraceae bacterium IS3]HAO20074.1 hypothetical protein [Desulfobacteraceae bacterium]